MRFIVVMIPLSLLSSCTNLPSGGRSEIRFLSEPQGALARTSIGPSCATPCALSISRLDSFSVTFEKPGFRPVTVDVASVLPPGPGIRAELGGGIGLRFGLADGGTSSDPTGRFSREHRPNPVTVRLDPL